METERVGTDLRGLCGVRAFRTPLHRHRNPLQQFATFVTLQAAASVVRACFKLLEQHCQVNINSLGLEQPCMYTASHLTSHHLSASATLQGVRPGGSQTVGCPAVCKFQCDELWYLPNKSQADVKAGQERK